MALRLARCFSTLQNFANLMRLDVLDITQRAGSGHPSSCASLAEVMAVLFREGIEEGDRFVLSKGHAAPILYSALYRNGIIGELRGFREISSELEGHPTPRLRLIDVATGSLG